MCIGIPMEIIESHEYVALCRGRNGTATVNMLLIGPQPVGAWIVNFLGSAREVISADEAEKINASLEILEAVIGGADDLDIDPRIDELLRDARKASGMESLSSTEESA